MDTEAGLRERKKRATRQRISDVATTLFADRGFDEVTTAQIAEAAEVSKMTVFNYFARKEDMFFDRWDEGDQLLAAAVRDRRTGESIPAALRQLVLKLAGQRHPLGGLRDGIQHFWQIVANSAALRAAARQSVDELITKLALVIAEEVKASPADATPELVAALIVAASRTVGQRTVRRLMAGELAEDIYPEHVALINQAFDLIDQAVGDYGARWTTRESRDVS